MKSLKFAAETPETFPLAADGITELHASRLLLLLKHCGTKGKIDGLTKLAKLDFFVRYPEFFDRIAEYLGKDIQSTTRTIESAMVRHHYGPWDKRYYHVLPFLKSRGLIKVQKEGSAYRFSLTDLGIELANKLAKTTEFSAQVDQMKKVKALLGSKTGNRIKELIYEAFDEEVSKKALGELIS